MEGLGSFAPFILMFVIFYFFIIAPKMKVAKQEKKFMTELKRGDKVIMKSGIHGKIVELNDKDGTCVIETGAGKIKFERIAISMEASKKLKTNTALVK